MNDERQPSDRYLCLEGVRRRFGGRVALDGVSLAVNKAEVTCLVGQSGCGKSSLLRIIAGVDQPDEGRVVLDGVQIASPDSCVEPEKRRIGFMFQDYALFPHLSVSQNIMFGLTHLARGEARQRCAAIIARLGLEDMASRFPHTLSGGEQQRVALGRALAPQPHVLLMDEPFSNLDRALRDDIRAETIALLRELGTTVIMVTHDPEEALSIGDRVILMRAGKIIQAGSSSDLYDNPTCAYAAEFFCSFNKIQGFCRNGFAETPLGTFAAPGHAEGAEATVYIRPQCLRVERDGDGIACTVVDRALMGEIEQIRLHVAALPELLRLRSTERKNFRAGDKARLSIAREHVLVF